MSGILDQFRFVLIALAGWMNQRQLFIIHYLREENRLTGFTCRVKGSFGQPLAHSPAPIISWAPLVGFK